MNITTVKKAKKRVDFPVITNLGIMSYGENNLYPQEIKNLAGSSDSAGSCIERYIDFIEGWGLADVVFSELKLNQNGETADDLISLISNDVGNFGGLALHINYNVFGKIVEIQHIPFENCRLQEPDEHGKIDKIAIHIDWTGKTKRAGKFVRVEKSNIDYINIFNPATVQQEIEANGGIENYKGQVLYTSNAGINVYPVPKHDKVIPQMSTEDGLGYVSNLNVNNGFMTAGLLFVNEALDTVDTSVEGVENNVVKDSIAEQITNIKSAENTASMGIIRPKDNVSIDDIDKFFKFVNLKGNNYDKDFTITTATATEKIYAAFNQEVFYRIRSGSMGFSTQIMSEAYEFYNTVTGKERRMIERAFDKIMKYWNGKIFTDFTIKPMKYISAANGNTSNK